jgi:hypothetical protein
MQSYRISRDTRVDVLDAGFEADAVERLAGVVAVRVATPYGYRHDAETYGVARGALDHVRASRARDFALVTVLRRLVGVEALSREQAEEVARTATSGCCEAHPLELVGTDGLCPVCLAEGVVP